MMFIFSKELKNNPKRVLKRICQFIGVESINYEAIPKVEINRNQIPRIKFISFIINHTFLEKKKYICQLNYKFNLKYNNKKEKEETRKNLEKYFNRYNQEFKKKIEKLNW